MYLSMHVSLENKQQDKQTGSELSGQYCAYDVKMYVLFLIIYFHYCFYQTCY